MCWFSVGKLNIWKAIQLKVYLKPSLYLKCNRCNNNKGNKLILLPNEFFEGLLLLSQSCEIALLFCWAPIYEEINPVGLEGKKNHKDSYSIKKHHNQHLRSVTVSAWQVKTHEVFCNYIPKSAAGVPAARAPVSPRSHPHGGSATQPARAEVQSPPAGTQNRRNGEDRDTSNWNICNKLKSLQSPWVRNSSSQV